MISKEYTIKNEVGLHARPAALFVQAANKFISEIIVKKGDNRINGKSIMGIMALGVSKGEAIEVIIYGPDENEALAAMDELLEVKLTEI